MKPCWHITLRTLRLRLTSLKRLTKDNNNQFAGVARSLTGSLMSLWSQLQGTPMAIKDPRITEFTLRISELEASRVEILKVSLISWVLVKRCLSIVKRSS